MDGVLVGGGAVDIDELPSPPSHNRLVPLITYQSPPLSVPGDCSSDEAHRRGGFSSRRPCTKPSAEGLQEAARAAERDTLQRWGIDPATSPDSSGLSPLPASRTSSNRLPLLRTVAHSEVLRSVYQIDLCRLPAATAPSELRMKGAAAEGRALMKTGSMTAVRTAAAFMSSRRTARRSRPPSSPTTSKTRRR